MTTGGGNFCRRKQAEHGQALVLIAVVFVVIVAFVGLATDVGQLFITMGSLRRAADAGALAAAGQFREGRSPAELEAAARETISLNGFDPGTVIVELCDPDNPDPDICPPEGQPLRKLVKVTASAQVPMSFLSVIGLRTFTITSSATSEAASMDVVLVIDISESMAFDRPAGNPLRDPSYCNAQDPGGADGAPGECQPFEDVKNSAIGFVSQILNKPPNEEEDRVAIVTFADGWSSDRNRGTHYRPNGNPYWTNDVAEAAAIIRGLRAYQPGICASNTWLSGSEIYGPCRNYNMDTGVYQGMYCDFCNPGSEPWNNPSISDPNPITDWSPYMTTNIGGGLRKGGLMFAHEKREDALWVVVLLTDGLANATDMDEDDDLTDITTYPIGFCPDWSNLCQDNDTTTRHSDGDAGYDADDYARDMADFVACLAESPAESCEQEGQGAVIFAIGLGDEVLNDYSGSPAAEVNNVPYGASLLRYIAGVGIDGDPSSQSDPCASVNNFADWCGNYFFAPDGNELFSVFEAIASRIFTRLTR